MFRSTARIRPRTVAALAAASLAAVGGGAMLATVPAGAKSIAHAAAAAPCPTAKLAVAFVNKPNGAAGTIYYPLKFTNRGSASCTLRGYPGVSAVTKQGKQIGVPASRGGATFKTVTVAPGKSASAMVGIAHTANFPKAKCKPVTAAGFRVFPPNQSASVIVKHSFSTCSTSQVSLTLVPIK